MHFNPPIHTHQTPKPTKQTQTQDVHQIAIDKTSANPNKALVHVLVWLPCFIVTPNIKHKVTYFHMPNPNPNPNPALSSLAGAWVTGAAISTLATSFSSKALLRLLRVHLHWRCNNSYDGGSAGGLYIRVHLTPAGRHFYFSL